MNPTQETKTRTVRDPGLNAVARVLRTLDDLEEHQLVYIGAEINKKLLVIRTIEAHPTARRYFPPGPAQRALSKEATRVVDFPEDEELSHGPTVGSDPEE